MKNDRLAFVQGKVGLIQLGQRQVVGTRDFFPRTLIRLADVDQDRALLQETLRFGGTDFRK
jgi:hypothetical protein